MAQILLWSEEAPCNVHNVHLIVGGKYTLRYLTLDPRNRELCFLYNVSDNSHVEGVQRATVFVETNESDVAVDMSPLQTTVNIYDNDSKYIQEIFNLYDNYMSHYFQSFM